MEINIIKQQFKDKFGCQDSRVYASPGRINLIGEHTDYNGSFVFPGAIDKGMVAVILANGTKKVRAWSVDLQDYAEFTMDETDLPARMKLKPPLGASPATRNAAGSRPPWMNVNRPSIRG